MKQKGFISRFLRWFNNIPVPAPYVGARTDTYVMISRVTIVVLPILFGAAIAVVLFLHLSGGATIRASSFSGKVGLVWKGERGYPIVKLNGQEHYLDWNGLLVGNQIEIGDSIVKKKGEMTLKLIKKDSGEILYFED